MATVQEKPPTKKQPRRTESQIKPKKQKFVQFDDPDFLVPGDEYNEDGTPTTSLKVIMTTVVVLPLVALLSVIAMSWQFGFMGWLYVGLLFGGWYLTGLGITVGYHRLFSHHSFQCTRGTKNFLGGRWSARCRRFTCKVVCCSSEAPSI